MPLQCDGGDENGECEACAQAQAFSCELINKIVECFKEKDLSDIQLIQSTMIAALAVVEISAGEDNKFDAAYVATEMVSEWAVRMANSQKVELKKTNKVANIIKGTKTLN